MTAKTANQNGAQPMFSSMSGALELGQAQAAEIWRRHYEVLSRYFANLARSQGVEGIVAANSALMADTLAEFGDFAARPAIQRSAGGEARPKA